jgi:hypothetical protein
VRKRRVSLSGISACAIEGAGDATFRRSIDCVDCRSIRAVRMQRREAVDVTARQTWRGDLVSKKEKSPGDEKHI